MKNGIVIGVISVFIAIVVIGSVLVPVIDSSTKTTDAIDNDGAVGLRMDKVTSGDFTLTYGLVGDDFTATNGTDAQVIDDMCIFYADDNFAVWMDDSSVRMVGKGADDQIINAALSDEATITITKSADGVNITDGTVDQTFPVPTWAYVPKSTGAYGFFLNETEINTGGLDVHYVGSFAGVNCYDSIIGYDLPLALDATINESTLTGAKWIKETAAPEDLNIDDLHIVPLDTSILDPEPDSLMYTPPTPQYTEGDWGYNLSGSDATIVSYSGAGGGIITVPATVGGYNVTTFGNGNTAFDRDNIVADGLIISEGIKTIGANVCYGCPGMTGYVSIPSTVTSIGIASFMGTGFNQTFIIPESVTYVGNNVINDTTMTGLVVMGNPTFTSISLNNSAITQVLNLGEGEITTTTGGMTADEVSSDIPALGYLAIAHQQGAGIPGALLLDAIPVIVIISVVMLAIGLFMVRRTE